MTCLLLHIAKVALLYTLPGARPARLSTGCTYRPATGGLVSSVALVCPGGSRTAHGTPRHKTHFNTALLCVHSRSPLLSAQEWRLRAVTESGPLSLANAELHGWRWARTLMCCKSPGFPVCVNFLSTVGLSLFFSSTSCGRAGARTEEHKRVSTDGRLARPANA